MLAERAVTLDYRQEQDVDALSRELQRELRRRGLDAETADDVTQEAWLRTLRRRPAGANLGGWLHVVGARLVLELRRSGRNRRARERAAARGERVDGPGADERERLPGFVDELGEPYRQVLYLRFVEDRSLEEIAALTGRPAATVRSQLHRGLERLRQRLAGEEPRRSLLGAVLAFLGLRRGAAVRRVAALAGVALSVLGILWWSGRGERGVAAGPELGARAEEGPASRRGALAPERSALEAPRAPSAAAPSAPEARAKVALTGRVLDSDGEIVPGAELWAGPRAGGGARRVAVADAAGRYAVAGLEAHEYLWALGGDGRPSRRCYLASVARGGEQDLCLTRTPGRLFLTLVDERSRPVAGAEVTLDGEVGRGLSGVISASGGLVVAAPEMTRGRTDASGRVALAKPEGPRFGLVVRRDGRAVQRSELEDEPGDQTLALALASPCSLRGVVRDLAGLVVAGAEVKVVQLASDLAELATTDADGRFELSGLVAGPFALMGMAEGEACTVEDALVEGERRELELVLAPVGTIRGVARDASGPLAGAEVRAFREGRDGLAADATATTDADGRFQLVGGHSGDVLRLEAVVAGERWPCAWSEGVPMGAEDVELVARGERTCVPVTLEFVCADATVVPTLIAVRGRAPRIALEAPVDARSLKAEVELPPGRYAVFAWVPGIGAVRCPEMLEVGRAERQRFVLPRPGRIELELVLPPGLAAADVRATLFDGGYLPFGFGELGSVSTEREPELDATGRLLSARVFPGKVSFYLRARGCADLSGEVRLAEGDHWARVLTPRPGVEARLAVDLSRALEVGETLRFRVRTADDEVELPVPPGSLRSQEALSPGRPGSRLDAPMALPLDLFELTADTNHGLRGARRFAPGELAALGPRPRIELVLGPR